MNLVRKILQINIKIPYAFIILAILNLLLCFTYFGRMGTFIVDVSREVYIPMAINDGGVLYKDIFNVYAPLAYQINAFITKIFSSDISTYYTLGYINSTLFLWGIFLLSRIFLKKINYQIPLYYTILVMFCAVYSVSITNYIFPYSYSMVYSLTAFLWSLIALLYYLRKAKSIFLYASFLLFGACISFKYEFILFGLILFYFFFKNTNIKQKLISLFSFILVPALSLSDLFIRGMEFTDLISGLKYMILLSKSHSAYNLYKFLGYIPNFESFKTQIISFISFLIVCIILILPVIITKKIRNNIVFFFAIVLETILLFFLTGIFVQSNAGFFSWIGIADLILLIILIIKYKNNILKENKLFFILFLSVILISFKSICFIALNSYGSYFLPLLLLCALIYLINYTNRINPIFISVLLILLAITFGVSNYMRTQLVHNIGLPFEKGRIYVEDFSAEAIWKTYQYIINETNQSDKILVLPEGAMFNYLTGRKSDNKYYYLLPSNVEIFEESRIMKDLEKNLPDYIIITPRAFADYNETYFCGSFGGEICKLLPLYYNKPIIQKGGYDYSIAIYKKRM